ncbi:MAG TPA: O-acetyl-ADP-ribose deacetylase [Candidatus Acidoferrales bacterium]|nr:O-acetyl-ADP-ribose deacetylase [Candidatus Acidoferrales bacterium]
MPIEVVVGDITRIPIDAIVNAANERLRGGGGVDGAIHRVAGPELLEACRSFGNCPTGEVRVTPAFQLPARHVIHAVGPIWSGGAHDEDRLLASAYRNALEAARELGAISIAFPAISTGVYGFPRDRAARIAIAQMRRWLAEGSQPLRIVLVSFDDAGAQIYRTVLEEL